MIKLFSLSLNSCCILEIDHFGQGKYPFAEALKGTWKERVPEIVTILFLY